MRLHGSSEVLLAEVFLISKPLYHLEILAEKLELMRKKCTKIGGSRRKSLEIMSFRNRGECRCRDDLR